MTAPGWLKGVPVAQAMAREHDNFAALRLALALAVVVSHAFSVTTGIVADEPFARATGYTLGEHAVNGFFAVSGFLVTMSFDRRGWRDYAIARLLRIAPGLIAATLAVALVLGGAVGRLPWGEYLASPGLWRSITGTLTTFKSNAALPGVFENNPFRFPMGTVWTLKYEVFCYAGVLAVGLVGGLGRPRAVLALVAALFLSLAFLEGVRPNPPKGLETALRLPLIFACGGALYAWRERAPVSGPLALALVLATVVGQGTALYPGLLFVAEAYGVIWLALAPGLSHPGLDLRADFSYGTYLYGWPVQQALHAVFPALSGAALLAPSLALTLAVAALSWYLVEKPALALKARALGRRTLGRIQPAGP